VRYTELCYFAEYAEPSSVVTSSPVRMLREKTKGQFGSSHQVNQTVYEQYDAN